MSRMSRLGMRLAITRLSPDAGVPPWALAGAFFSVSRTRDELSIVCDECQVPVGLCTEPGWIALVVDGPMDLSSVGVLAGIARPLADAGIAIFAISTFNTDYILVREHSIEQAETALKSAGHGVV